MTAHPPADPVTFDAELWIWDARKDGGWTFLTLPDDVSDDIRDHHPRDGGFGSVPVTVTIGATTWRTSVFPQSGGGPFVLPVKKAVRRAEGVEAGDRVRVRLHAGASPVM